MTNQTIARLRPSSLRSAAQSRVAQTYRPDPVRLGRVALRRNRRCTTMQLGNGTTRAYAYDANSRLTTQIELNGATQLVTIVDSYDPVGNRIGRNLDGVLTTWTYDDLYRLTHQDKTGQVCTYVLDPVGNLEVMWEGGAAPKTFTFDAADRLVTMALGANLTTFTYSDFGALASEVTGSAVTTYTYDGQDQLIGVLTSAGVRSTYTFDGDGMRRTAQEGNVQPTTMVWDGSDYLFLDGPSTDQLVLTLDGEIVACGSKDLLTDPLGTLLREISAGASLSSLFSMYPYGSPVVPAFSTPTIPFRYIAASGYFFDTNDRDYVRARELEKRLGRWMQTDPLWPRERAFGYVDGRLMTLTDASGLAGQSIGIGIGIGLELLYGSFPNCPSWVGRIAIQACGMLKSLLADSKLDAINSCYTKSLRKTKCKPLTRKDLECLSNSCSNKVISCNGDRCRSNICGNTLVSNGKCDVQICVSTICDPKQNCHDIGPVPWPDKNIQDAAVLFNILHELGHCCGIEHGTKDKSSECNDILACCVSKVVRGAPSLC